MPEPAKHNNTEEDQPGGNGADAGEEAANNELMNGILDSGRNMPSKRVKSRTEQNIIFSSSK